MLLAEDSKPLCVSFVFCLLLLKYSGQRVQHIHCCLLPAFSTLLLFVENDAVFCAWCVVGSCGNTVPAPDGSTICMTSHSCWCCPVALCVAPFVTVCTVSHSGLTRQDAVEILERLAKDSVDCIRRMAFISLAMVIIHQPNGSEKVDALRKTLDERIKVPGHFFTVDACPEGKQAVPWFRIESFPCHLFEQPNSLDKNQHGAFFLLICLNNRILWTKTCMERQTVVCNGFVFVSVCLSFKFIVSVQLGRPALPGVRTPPPPPPPPSLCANRVGMCPNIMLVRTNPDPIGEPHLCALSPCDL